MFGKHRVLLPLLTVFVAGAGACDTSSSGPAPAPVVSEPPSEPPLSADRRAWADLKPALQERSTPLADRLRMAQGFLAAHPGSAHAAEARDHVASLEAEIAHAQEQADETRARDAAEAKHNAELRMAAPKEVALRLAFEAAATGSGDPDDEAFRPLELMLPSPPKTIAVKRRYTQGAGGLNHKLMRLVERSSTAQVPSSKAPRWRRRVALLNPFFQKSLGGDLYDAQTPAHLNASALSRLLSLIQVAPGDPVLGVTGQQLFSIYQHTAHDYARVYSFLRDDVGRAKVVKLYKEAHARHGAEEDTSYNNDMMEFYYTVPEQLGLVDKVELHSARGLYVTVGFWMRRMADGTDKVLFLHLQKVLEAYDPGFAIKRKR